MAKKLNQEILRIIKERTGKSAEKIRPRLSELRRRYSGLTLNAAAQLYAEKHGTSIMAKLDVEDRQSLTAVQSITQVNTSKTVKIDKRTMNITNSPIHNLSFGDRTTVSQSVVNLDKSLAYLFDEVEKTGELSAEEKNDFKSDIKSLASQIGKSRPSTQIIKAAWRSIQGLADIEGFAQLISRIAPLIQGFLS